MEEKVHNPARYAVMCEPFKDDDEAEAAIKAFCDGVEALRTQHRIKDVGIVFEVSQFLESGEEGIKSGSMHLGHVALAESMLAFAYGRERKRREELLARLATWKR